MIENPGIETPLDYQGRFYKFSLLPNFLETVAFQHWEVSSGGGVKRDAPPDLCPRSLYAGFVGAGNDEASTTQLNITGVALCEAGAMCNAG